MDLKRKIKKMLEGEKKRRDIALRWLKEVVEVLLPVSRDIWGGGDYFADAPTNSTGLHGSNIYFRYCSHEGEQDIEEIGFYLDSQRCNLWGIPLASLRGKEFWNGILSIIEWIPTVSTLMEGRHESRNAILKKINLEEDDDEKSRTLEKFYF